MIEEFYYLQMDTSFEMQIRSGWATIMYTYVERIRTSILSRVPQLEWHFERNGISSEKSFINIGYGNLRADRSVCFLERVFLCYIPSFGI